MTLENIVLVTGGTLTGLLAGLFYAFNVAIIPALRSLKGQQHVATMQAINTKIQNPAFFLSFFGPTLLLPLAAYLYRGTVQFPLLLAATTLHILGSNGVTIVGNLPLNAKLEKNEAQLLSDNEADRIRHEFQGPGSPWMRLHNVRTVTAILATGLVFIACLSSPNTTS